jgi:hypothetical protein
MKTQIKKVTIEGRKVWQWRILDGRRIAYGGLCATKRDAANDAGIVLRDALATRPNAKLCGLRGDEKGTQ